MQKYRLKNSYQSGQAVLIVLLSLSVVLIIVLYIMSRSITDISLSTKDQDSMRAFSAAEAGIERALVIGSSIGNTTIGDANFSATIVDFGSGQSSVVYPVSLKSGEIGTFWFNRPSEIQFTGTQAKVCWGAAGTAISSATTPAVEISVFHKQAGVYKVARAVLDPYPGRASTYNFSAATASPCTVDGESFAFQTTISFASLGSLEYMTVKPLYNTTTSQKVAIDVSGSGSLLPSQGKKVNSNGSSVDSNRSIEAYESNSVIPSVFMNTVYSSSGISQ